MTGESEVRAAVRGTRPKGWPDAFVRNRRDRDALLVLAHTSLIPHQVHELAWREGTARGCLAAVVRGAVGSARDSAVAGTIDPATVRTSLDRSAGRMVIPGDREYPEACLELADPPGWLFLRGRPLPASMSVAVVGARACSPYGWEVARAIGAGLARAGVPVVSGAARGIDEAAHRGALDAGGPTVAVLGCGIDRSYPRTSAGLLTQIARVGTVMSEYPPGAPPQSRWFPARNRLIAGLARAVVVVEGDAGSGSRITAEHAMDLNREVVAVPGPVTSPLSTVPNELIHQGAPLVRDADDILEGLGLLRLGGEEPGTQGLSKEERAVMAAVAGHPVAPDHVAAAASVPVPRALATLGGLELRGLVRREGGRYRRTGG